MSAANLTTLLPAEEALEQLGLTPDPTKKYIYATVSGVKTGAGDGYSLVKEVFGPNGEQLYIMSKTREASPQ